MQAKRNSLFCRIQIAVVLAVASKSPNKLRKLSYRLQYWCDVSHRTGYTCNDLFLDALNDMVLGALHDLNNMGPCTLDHVIDLSWGDYNNCKKVIYALNIKNDIFSTVG